MDYTHKYNNIVFGYHFFIVLYLVILFAFFRGDLRHELMAVVIVAALGYFVMNFRNSHKSKKEDRAGTEKEKRCHMLFLGVAVFISCMVTAEKSADMLWQTPSFADVIGVGLLVLLLFAIFALYFYADYFQAKYLTMYANPGVTRETIRRFEKNTFAALKKKMLKMGIFVVVFLTFSMLLALLDREPQQTETERPKAISEKSVEKTRTINPKQVKAHQEAEKKERSPFWEIFLAVLAFVMKVVILILLIVGGAAVLFLLFRKLFRSRIPGYERVSLEKDISEEGTDEYISLRRETQRQEEFSADNNGKIRKYFYRYIRKRAKGSVNRSLTPWELAREYMEEGEQELPENDRQAVELYEKARYSGKMCSEEEVEIMKEKTS